MPHHARCLLNSLLSQPLLLWLLSGTSFSQLYDCSLEASVPAATTVWSPAQQQHCCQKYMQETTYVSGRSHTIPEGALSEGCQRGQHYGQPRGHPAERRHLRGDRRRRPLWQ